MLLFSKKNIIITVIVLLIGLLSLIVFLKVNSYQESMENTIIIDNIEKYNQYVDPRVFSNISSAVYLTTIYNTKTTEKNYHGLIRGNTFKYVPKKSISFIIDIPELKVSWRVGQTLNRRGAPVSGTLVECISKDQIIPQTTALCVSGGDIRR